MRLKQQGHNPQTSDKDMATEWPLIGCCSYATSGCDLQIAHCELSLAGESWQASEGSSTHVPWSFPRFRVKNLKITRDLGEAGIAPQTQPISHLQTINRDINQSEAIGASSSHFRRGIRNHILSVVKCSTGNHGHECQQLPSAGLKYKTHSVVRDPVAVSSNVL